MRAGEGPSAERLQSDYRAFRKASRSWKTAIPAFRRIVLRFYGEWGRDLPWRRTKDPYRILVSEFMLQQTQVQRVLVKYGQFLARFPDPRALAGAPLSEVLSSWQGLGYNRRAKALREAARRILADFGGDVPCRQDQLTSLPGVGRATAGAVQAFAFGLPAVFVETNIRRVYLHFFHPRRKEVTDAEILSLVDRTLDRSDPRRWYYALMDYGSHLGRGVSNANRRSAHYRKQAPFEGSNRQVRSAALRLLLSSGPLAEEELVERLGVEGGRARRMIEFLVKEGFVVRRRGKCAIA